MGKLHSRLIKKNEIYHKWHGYRYHQFFHWLVFVAVALLLSVSILSSSANYDVPGQAEVFSLHQTKVNLPQLTNKLFQAISQYEMASDTDKLVALDNVVVLASSRKQAMLAEASHNPKSFLLATLPPGILTKIPSEISNMLEQETEIQGELTIFYGDRTDESEDGLIYKIKDEATGKNYNIRLNKADPMLKSGSIVKVDGYRLDQEMVITDSATSSGLTILETPSFSRTGDQHTLVMLINFRDRNNQPWTPAQVAGTLFTDPDSVNTYYKESSFNLASLSGDVANWITVPYDSTSCAAMYDNTWVDLANSAATKAGFVLSNYNHLLYVLSGPTENDCGFAGMSSYLGSNPSSSWVLALYGGLKRHELGHAMGMLHASAIDCGTEATGNYSLCKFSDRGDIYDVMGSINGDYYDLVGSVGSGYTQNGAHKVQQTWIPPTRIQTVTTNGSYTIAPLEVLSDKPQVLKILKPDSYDSSTGQSYYYLDYRQPLGFDQTLPAGITGGVGVVVWPANASGGNPLNTLRLDTTPGDGDWSNSSLSDGGVFVDTINGIRVTQTSHTSSGATVQVTFGPGVCSRSLPTITTPNINQGGSAGQTLTYSVTISNHDSPSCPSSTFSTSTIGLPLGFTALANPYIVNIASGSTANIAVAVTSPVSSTNSLNPFTVITTDTLDSSRTASAQTSYSVIRTGVASPIVTLTSPIDGSTLVPSRKVSSLQIAAKASDSSGISKIELYMDGKLIKTCTRKATSCSTSVSLGSITTGSHAIVAKALNNSGVWGNSTTVYVTKN